jgi:hypothetical protein
MKVKDLIEELKKYDPEMEVSINDILGGVTDKFILFEIKVCVNIPHGKVRRGEHGIVSPYLAIEKGAIENRLLIDPLINKD